MFEVLEREATSDDQSNQESKIAQARDARQCAQGRSALAPREVAIPADYIITPEIVGFNMTSKRGEASTLAESFRSVRRSPPARRSRRPS